MTTCILTILKAGEKEKYYFVSETFNLHDPKCPNFRKILPYEKYPKAFVSFIVKHPVAMRYSDFFVMTQLLKKNHLTNCIALNQPGLPSSHMLCVLFLNIIIVPIPTVGPLTPTCIITSLFLMTFIIILDLRDWLGIASESASVKFSFKLLALPST